MKKHYDDLMIELEMDEPSRSSPALGQVDRLLRQSALETQSLQVVRRIMMRDMLDRAQITSVTKLSSAAGMRDKQRLLTAATNGNGHAPWSEEAPLKKKRKNKGKFKGGRKPVAERMESVRQYLEQHPGSDTHAIARGLGWRSNQALKFARLVGRSESQGNRQPLRWYPKTTEATASAPKAATTPATRRGRATPAADEYRRKIQAFLAKHPEAFTKEIAQFVKRPPNSGFVKILRTVAKPVRPTLATQPIQWVLTA
jgi:hypothetical protein